jgi:hypothetical protein
MNDNYRRSVKFSEAQLNTRGDVYAMVAKIGYFVAYAADYTLIVIEDEFGKIHRIPIDDVHFTHPGE